MLKINEFMSDESGQGLAEYALILALVAVVAIAALNLLGPAINNKLNAVTTAVNA